MKESAANAPARTRLTTGPAIAIFSSPEAVLGSPFSLATPPNSHRVMPSTSTPRVRATNACPISCARRHAKKTIAVSVPPAQ